MSLIKQTIVVRTKYPDGKGGLRNLRFGKLIAQSCHASMAFLAKKVMNNFPLSEVEKQWLDNSYAKICLYVDSEEELLKIHNDALEAGLESNLVTDSGKTEFHGIATNTVIAIGPDYSEKIDKITNNLKLY